MNSPRIHSRRKRTLSLVACLTAALVLAGIPCRSFGQEHVIEFDMDVPGVDKPMKTWGVQTIGGPGVVQSALDNMGEKNIKMILIPFPLKDPLTANGQLSPAAKAQLDGDLDTAKLAGNKPFFLSPDTEAGVHAWYHTGPGRIDAKRYAQYLLALVKYVRRPVGWVQPFNEPDWGQWNQGSQQDLKDIMALLAADPKFQPTKLAGPAVLNIDTAMGWYGSIKDHVTLGTMHTLNGSVDSYVNFIKGVKAGGKIPFNPELHNLVEAIIGAEHGMEGGIWWMACSETRGNFVKACQAGKRLGYTEVRPNWSAAAIYRTSNSTAWAFLGSNERTGKDTTYRFVCRDREVRFDGGKPTKEFKVTIERDKEKMIKITR